MSGSPPASDQPFFEASDDSGLVFSFGFAEDGCLPEPGQSANWTWRNYALADLRARRSIEADPSLPDSAKASLLSSQKTCHLDYEDGWLYGELPDLWHQNYSPGREVGHLHLAVCDRTLVTARRQPLRAIESGRAAVERGRRFRSPFELFDTLVSHTLSHLDAEVRSLGEALDRIEDRIVTDSWHGEREALTATRRDSVRFHRQVATMTSLLRDLAENHEHDLPPVAAGILGRLAARSRGLDHDCEQMQARARLLQDELLAKLTAQSNRLLYFLSVLTAVLMPMTVISGLFGMNIEGIPLAHSSTGFWVVSSVAIAVSVAVLVGVRRLGRLN